MILVQTIARIPTNTTKHRHGINYHSNIITATTKDTDAGEKTDTGYEMLRPPTLRV